LLLLVFDRHIGLGGWLLACLRGGPGSIPGHSMWWTACHCDRFVSECFGVQLSVPSHQCSIVTHSCVPDAVDNLNNWHCR